MNCEMNGDESLWQRDAPSQSDMTFVLATLQRIEQRRFQQGLLWVLSAGLVSAATLWLFWPMFWPVLLEWGLLLVTLLQAMTQMEWWAVSLVVTVIAVLELRVFR